MGKALTIFGSLALILLGVQICQFGLIPTAIDYDSINAVFVPETPSPPQKRQPENLPPPAQRLQVNKNVERFTDVKRDNTKLTKENEELKFEIEKTKRELFESQQHKEVSQVGVPVEAVEDGNDTTLFSIYDNSHCDGHAKETAKVKGTESVIVKPSVFPKSARVLGGGMAEVFIRLGREYQGILVEGDECFQFPIDIQNTKMVEFELHSGQKTPFKEKRQIPQSLQQQFSTAPDLSQPQTKIVFSSQSSHYFGYQVLASAFSFLRSNQTNASWMRLLTSRTPDDLSERFPTFSAPKTLYSRTYNPVNKPDVMTKWFQSPDAPHPDDTILVVDPDSWLLKDLHPWTLGVSKGHALGQAAYYAGQNLCQDLWKEICLENCDVPLDLVGVPYVLKASDLKAVAPLWKKYSLIVKDRLRMDSFKTKYGHLGFDWASEMIGYNAACAHLNIKTRTVRDLQVRDVESNFRLGLWNEIPTIHVGRAWFPIKDAEMAEQWRDEDDGGLHRGKRIQVWCKCNQTAAEIQPWPIPNRTSMDFVSYHTLTLLHDSIEHFGPVPVNESFRKPDRYYSAAP